MRATPRPNRARYGIPDARAEALGEVHLHGRGERGDREADVEQAGGHVDEAPHRRLDLVDVRDQEVGNSAPKPTPMMQIARLMVSSAPSDSHDVKRSASSIQFVIKAKVAAIASIGARENASFSRMTTPMSIGALRSTHQDRPSRLIAGKVKRRPKAARTKPAAPTLRNDTRLLSPLNPEEDGGC